MYSGCKIKFRDSDCNEWDELQGHFYVEDILRIEDEDHSNDQYSLEDCVLSIERTDIFDDIDEEPTQDMTLIDSLGRMYNGIFYSKITNIRRVRKGKRYIIKFDYTCFLEFRGRLIDG